MSVFGTIAGLLGGPIRGVIDDIHTSDEEKAKASLAMEKVLQAQRSDIEKTIRAELETRADILKAEMAQGDAFTKRARPSVVYFGLAAIGLNHIVLPWAAYFAGSDTLPSIALPDQFWWAWSGVCSVWFLGRSIEKRGAVSEKLQSVVGAVTGGR